MKSFIIENYNKMGKLTLYLILLLVFTSIDYLLNVRWINSMKNYTIISIIWINFFFHTYNLFTYNEKIKCK